MPSTAATASGTAAGSPTGASSITHTPSGKSSAERAADLQRESGLADPADTGQRHQPVRLERRLQLGEFASRGRRSWCVGGRRLPGVASSGPQRWELGAQARRPGPGTPRTGLAMSRSRLWPQVRSARRRSSSAAVAPSSRIWPPWPAAITRAVRLSTGAEVVAAAQLGLAGGDAHPHRQLQRALRGDRGVDGRARRREHRAHPVAGVLERRGPRGPRSPRAAPRRAPPARPASRPGRPPTAASNPRCR